MALSLVEVLIASAILAVVMVPMMGMFTLGRKTSVLGERRAIATFFAQEVLERFRQEADHDTLRSQRLGGIPRIRVDPPEGFQYQMATQRLGDGLIEVSVKVYWKNGKKSQHVELGTLHSQRPAILRYLKPGGGARSYDRSSFYGGNPLGRR